MARKRGSRNKGFWFRKGRGWYVGSTPLKDPQGNHIKDRDAQQAAEQAYHLCMAGQGNGEKPRVEDWYVDWLVRLRLGQPPVEPRAGQRVAEYLAKTHDGRRLAFSTVLARVLPESRRAPLVLFQLFPLAVHLVTALAFGDNKAASVARSQQIALLPGIGDCRECRGRVLESGEQCPACGNPLWKSEWLTEMD